MNQHIETANLEAARLVVGLKVWIQDPQFRWKTAGVITAFCPDSETPYCVQILAGDIATSVFIWCRAEQLEVIGAERI